MREGPCPACDAKYIGVGRWLCGRRMVDGKITRRCKSSTQVTLEFLYRTRAEGRKVGFHPFSNRPRVETRVVLVRKVIAVMAPAPQSNKVVAPAAVMSAANQRSKK